MTLFCFFFFFLYTFRDKTWNGKRIKKICIKKLGFACKKDGSICAVCWIFVIATVDADAAPATILSYYYRYWYCYTFWNAVTWSVFNLYIVAYSMQSKTEEQKKKFTRKSHWETAGKWEERARTRKHRQTNKHTRNDIFRLWMNLLANKTDTHVQWAKADGKNCAESVRLLLRRSRIYFINLKFCQFHFQLVSYEW